MHLSFIEIVTVFMVLFAVIDITGSIPIIIEIKHRIGKINPLRATLASFGLLLAFFFIGEPFLHLFGVDVNSFAIAGSIVVFIIGIEMILGVQIFNYGSTKGASIVPIAFPLIAGAGSFTTILSLKSGYQTINIIIALLLNMIFVYFILRATDFFEKIIGETGIQILRKFFGIILLAIAIKLFLFNTGIHLPNAR